VANDILAIAQEKYAPNEHEEGTDNDGIDSPESVARAHRRLVDECASIREEYEQFKKERK
jgi:hypothetical protein